MRVLTDRRVWFGWLAAASLVVAGLACGVGPNIQGPAATARAFGQTAEAAGQQLQTVAASGLGTATVMAGTLAAAATEAAPTLQAAATGLAPTLQAAGTQLAGAVSTAATALASITPPQPVGQAEASAVLEQYARDILGLEVKFTRAGGLTGDLERQITLPQSADEAQTSAAALAVVTVAGTFDGGAGSVSYGSGTLSGDVSVDISAASLGAFAIDGGPVPASEAEALALALRTFPGLAGRTLTVRSVPQGYAWSAQGKVPGFDPVTRQPAMVTEAVLLAVVPAGSQSSAISAVVGRGEFAANVIP